MSAGLADHMTMTGSAEQLALDLAQEIAQVGLSIKAQQLWSVSSFVFRLLVWFSVPAVKGC